MSNRQPTPDPADVFIGHLARIDDALAKLAKLRADHLGVDADNLTWGDVGDACKLADALKAAVDPWGGR